MTLPNTVSYRQEIRRIPYLISSVQLFTALFWHFDCLDINITIDFSNIDQTLCRLLVDKISLLAPGILPSDASIDIVSDCQMGRQRRLSQREKPQLYIIIILPLCILFFNIPLPYMASTKYKTKGSGNIPIAICSSYGIWSYFVTFWHVLKFEITEIEPKTSFLALPPNCEHKCSYILIIPTLMKKDGFSR